MFHVSVCKILFKFSNSLRINMIDDMQKSANAFHSIFKVSINFKISQTCRYFWQHIHLERA